MKIIKPHLEVLPPLEAPWWHGQKIECHHCGTIVEIEKEDIPELRTVDKLKGLITAVHFDCPNCKAGGLAIRRPYEIDPATFERVYMPPKAVNS